MIEPMKKYTFLVYHRNYDAFLSQLRDAGVLHIRQREGVNLSENPELRDQLEKSKRYAAMSKTLKALVGKEETLAEADASASGEALLASFEAICAKKGEQQLVVANLQKEIDSASVWGYFDRMRIEALQNAGCQVDFYCCPSSSYKAEWETSHHAVKVSERNGVQYFVAITLTEASSALDDLPADHVRMPASSLADLEERLTAVNKELAEMDASLHQAAVENLQTLQLEEARLRDNYALKAAACETEKVADEKLMLLEGYVPEVSEPALVSMLEKADAYYQCEAAQTDAPDVPIKLRNGKFAKLYEPLTKLYALPSYAEFDPTAAFAPFFTLFFGLCLGDGGYGLLVFLAATFAKKKFPAFKAYATMGQWLGLATILVGLLTGMVFGVSLETVAWPWLANVKHLFVTSNNYKPLGYDPMMVFAICIGILQILFAMGFKIARICYQTGIKYALSELGWLVLLIDMIVLLIVKFSVESMPVWASYTIWGIACVCAVFIFFFNSPGKNPLLQFGSGLWGTYNMISGLLGDVLSYIRLFALGLAGGILGGVFNSLAFSAGGALPVWIGWLVTAAVLAFGHGLNLFLCIISSIVHPLRLTYVEFFKNCGYEGGGTEYDPLRRTAQA